MNTATPRPLVPLRPRAPRIIIPLLVLALASIPVLCADGRNTDLFAELEGRIAAAREALERDPGDSSLLTSLAELLASAGDYEDAALRFDAALRADASNLAARAGAAKLLIRQILYPQALELLGGAPGQHPGIDALRADILFGKSDFAAAERLYGRLVQVDAVRYVALVGKARCLRARKMDSEARTLLRKAVEVSPKPAEAYSELAFIEEEERRIEEALQLALKAVEADPLSSVARMTLGYFLFRSGDMRVAVEHLKIAVRLDPFNHRAALFLGSGFNAEGYGGDVAPARSRRRRADKLLDAGDAAGAEAGFRQKLEEEPGNLVALTALASVLLRRGDDVEALRFYREALEVDPGWGPAHFGVAQVLKLRQDRYDLFSPLFAARLRNLVLAEPPALREVFINYDSLAREEKMILLVSIRPLQRFLPALARRGATHYILPLHKQLWQAPQSASIRGRRTPDGRLWDDVKGIGGLHGVSGVSTLWDAANGGLNILAHEFAHQVYFLALPKKHVEKIGELYQRALKEGRTLDFYSASNVSEYFAQGVEAYASAIKRPNLKTTADHTRQELLERDPGLFRLVAELAETEVEAYKEPVGASEADK